MSFSEKEKSDISRSLCNNDDNEEYTKEESEGD